MFEKFDYIDCEVSLITSSIVSDYLIKLTETTNPSKAKEEYRNHCYLVDRHDMVYKIPSSSFHVRSNGVYHCEHMLKCSFMIYTLFNFKVGGNIRMYYGFVPLLEIMAADEDEKIQMLANYYENDRTQYLKIVEYIHLYNPPSLMGVSLSSDVIHIADVSLNTNHRL